MTTLTSDLAAPLRIHTARLAVAISWLGPTLMLGALVGLTIHQRAFLSSVGWDPIGRTQTQWPSLLALGPDGWILTAVFALGAGSALALALSIALVSATRDDLLLSAICVALAIGLTCVTFSADLPGRPQTWHAAVHNAGYPLIPLAILVGATLTSRQSAQRATQASRWILGIIVIAFPLTGFDPIAQLSRYFLFAALMAWVLVLIASQRSRLVRSAADSRSPRASH